MDTEAWHPVLPSTKACIGAGFRMREALISWSGDLIVIVVDVGAMPVGAPVLGCQGGIFIIMVLAAPVNAPVVIPPVGQICLQFLQTVKLTACQISRLVTFLSSL